jgi:hypothetical protein
MALGGGNIKTTTFPGAYINFVSTSNSRGTTLGERGIVALCYKLPKATEKAVVECTSDEFYGAANPLGAAYGDDSMWVFREIFRHARKVVVYNMANDGATLAAGLTALEAYEFNIIVNTSSEASDATAIVTRVKNWRDNLGKKCQAVVYNHAVEGDLNTIATINVASKVIVGDSSVYTESGLVYWVAGAMAGCAVNKACTNMLYDGELTVEVAYSQSELQAALDAGKVVFHLVYGEVRMLEDVNSLVTPEADQNEDFKYNQTIRVIDQIANDIAYLFNTKYLGKIQNNASGRISLWNDIVSHHKQLEVMGAIEGFASEHVVVQMGDTIRSVVVQDTITVTGTMSQLFMTVVIE